MSKKELVAEAKKLGVEVEKGDTVADIEAKLAQHAAETAQSHEDDGAAAVEMAVRVQNVDGEVTLIFGTMVPSETDPPVFEGVQAYAVSVDDAHLLHHDLPAAIHEASIVNHHSG